MGWYQKDRDLNKFVHKMFEATLASYKEDMDLIDEHFGIESQASSGTYGYHTLFELVQNGADALGGGEPGEIELRLTPEYLYCANQGQSITEDGVRSILKSHNSYKSGHDIGHFGMGFKSVLLISDMPEFLSTAASFRFYPDPKRVLEGIHPKAKGYPRLRLAEPIETPIEDPNLEALCNFTTVVRLPLKQNVDLAELNRDLAGFRREFLLFSPQVKKLTLCPAQGDPRILTLETCQTEGDRIIIEGGLKSRWRCFAYQIPIEELDAKARERAADHLSDETLVSVHWAVWLGDKSVPSGFWAFFPTRQSFTLRGILNAPWKTTQDRQHLNQDDAFNLGLLKAITPRLTKDLVALFPEFAGDPGALLDVLPTVDDCGKGHLPTADLGHILAHQVYEHLKDASCIANGMGELVLPAKVDLRPELCMKPAVASWIKNYEPHLATFVHPSVETSHRRGRAKALGTADMTVASWIQAIVLAIPEDRVVASKRALSLAVAMMNDLPELEWKAIVKECPLILGTDGNMHLVREIHLPGVMQEAPEGILFPDPALLEDEETRQAMKSIGTVPLDEKAYLGRLLASGSSSDSNWSIIWRLVAQGGELLTIFNSHIVRLRNLPEGVRAVRVKNQANKWVHPEQLMRQGSILDCSRVGEKSYLLDEEPFGPFSDEICKTLKVWDKIEKRLVQSDETLTTYEDSCKPKFREEYLRTHPMGRCPQDRTLSFDCPLGPGPLYVLSDCSISNETKSRACAQAISILSLPTCSHFSMSYNGFLMNFESPYFGHIRKYGSFPTTLGARCWQEVFHPALSPWGRFIPVLRFEDGIQWQSAIDILQPKQSLANLDHETWNIILQKPRQATDLKELCAFLAEGLNQHLALPERFWCLRAGPTTGEQEPDGGVIVVEEAVENIALTDSKVLADWFISKGLPFLMVASKDLEILSGKGFRRADVQPDFESAEAPFSIQDRFSGGDLPGALRHLELQPCYRLAYVFSAAGQVPESVEKTILIHDETVYFLKGLAEYQLIEKIYHLFGLPLSSQALETFSGEATRRHNRGLAAERGLNESQEPAIKLLFAVGAEALRAHVPIESRTGMDEQIGRDFLLQHGNRSLARCVRELEERGFQPPRFFDGGDRAMDFCEDLGFTLNFAGSAEEEREPWIEANGPRRMGPAHPYQEEIIKRVRAFLSNWNTDQKPQRGMISLPTGAGKTRVAVEALIGAMKESRPGTYVWIAQNDELLEQAVLAWQQGWEAFGAEGEVLRISRLWDKTNNRVVRAPVRNHVVVASYQSLFRRIHQDRYKWIRDSACVVVDEAHGAITKSYNKIFRYMGLLPGASARPLIGLTATPFRGNENIQETKTLVRKFGGHRFDHGVFGDENPYAYLQNQKFLAIADHRELTGATIILTADEVERLGQGPVTLPDRVERMLGLDIPRSAAILEEIRSLDPAWQVLVFATSVQHAHSLAETITRELGRTAAAISSSTPKSERREIINKFRMGDIRVLANHSVLTAGFDAPKVRAIIVARPVFSPVTYMQMIGRGLRGPMNNGTDRCLIVNVKDTIKNFGPALAYSKFEDLWCQADAAVSSSEPPQCAKG